MRLPLRSSWAFMLAGRIGITVTSDIGRSWQARRIDGFAETPMASNTKASRPEGRGSLLRSLRTRIRHVEQRARPPQTLA
jgi:hypothetical protein